MKFYKLFFKRFIDIIGAIILLIVISPIFIFVTIFLAINHKSGVFFIQKRPGKHGKIFKLYKFKTMTDEKDENGNLLPDDKRITKIGAFIRATSLDEIPQLINVLKGDMSFIGPRPLMPKYLPLYSKQQYRRHEVRPGISGWAQVNGRNNISWKKKFELDVWYVDNLSFLIDFKITYLTVLKVIKRENVAKQGHATTIPFNGHN